MSAASTAPLLERILASVSPLDVLDMQSWARSCEALRGLAKRDTGSISLAAAVYLRAMTRRFRPKVAVEVGTFIGMSTLAITAGHVYTCDKSNDCLPSTGSITCHPFTGSTRMLSTLAKKRRGVDFFFFDGRIRDKDLDLIAVLATTNAVYAFDDFEGDEKGVVNVKKLWATLRRGYALMPPPVSIPHVDGTTTIAALVPPERV